MIIAAIGFFAATLATATPFALPDIQEPAFSGRNFSIADFGAKEGEKATDVFAAAMAACEKAGGGAGKCRE